MMSTSRSLASDAQLAALRTKLSTPVDYSPAGAEERRRQQGIVTAQLAADRCEVKPATIRKWLQRGKLTSCGHDEAGRVLVVLREVEELAFHDLRRLMGQPALQLFPAGLHRRVGDDNEPRYNFDEVELITVRQAADFFDVSPSTVRSWASRGFKDSDGSRRFLPALEINGCREKLYDFRTVSRAAHATAARAGRLRRYSPEVRAQFEIVRGQPRTTFAEG